MSVNLTIPSVGESISEGTIARWLKKDGERVEQGEPLFELETDKATTEIPAPSAGTLHISVAEGNTVAVGATIGSLEESGNGRKEAKEKPKAAAKSEEKKPAREEPQEKAKEAEAPPESPKQRPAEKPAAQPSEQKSSPRAPPLSPAARRLAREKALATAELRNDGQQEPQTLEPAERERAGNTHAETADAGAPKPEDRGETRKPMSAIRQRIARHLLASVHNTATLTTFNEADLSELQELRARYQDSFREKHGVKLGLVSFFVKACTEALQAYPIVNAFIDQQDIVYHDYCHIGVAVSTEKGLMVPVLHHAERMSIAEIEKKIAELAEKARAGKISVQDLKDGTFTISNGGVFGSLLSTPILNPPQSAILGLHTIQKRPVAVDEQVVIRPMMYLALSYDHRLIDGKDAVQFLARVKEYVEKPERMLLEI
jgi:2-oxoglutarate dehydrogenase E2 component (dihydrolipoamide succinyltransferase)